MTTDIAFIILAGGRGTRFDPSGEKSKLLASLPDGRSVIRATVSSAMQVSRRPFVIGSRDNYAPLRDALSDLDVHVEACPTSDAGIGATLKYGLRRARPAIGWVVMLGDMPHLQASTLRAVGDSLRNGAELARPFLAGQPGHPVGISRAMEDQFLGLPDAEGGARIFKAHADRVARISTDDPGCMLDIDRPQDLVVPAVYR